MKGSNLMIKVLTSDFNNEFPESFSMLLKKYVKSGMSFVFVASEFKNFHEKTDRYCEYFLKMFSDCGIVFSEVKVVDSRLTKDMAQKVIAESDVVWLAGGDTLTQYQYFEEYGLVSCLRKHQGVVIGMSAGSINMLKTAICAVASGHDQLSIYEALGIVDFSVIPHFNKNNISDELITISKDYPLYGISDNSAIFVDDEVVYTGEIFLIEDGRMTRL